MDPFIFKIFLNFFSPAVFWGDIALDEEDLKLFHIDKARDWIKQSGEEGGHSTGKYCVPHFFFWGAGSGTLARVDVDPETSVFDLSVPSPPVWAKPEGSLFLHCGLWNWNLRTC